MGFSFVLDQNKSQGNAHQNCIIPGFLGLILPNQGFGNFLIMRPALPNNMQKLVPMVWV